MRSTFGGIEISKRSLFAHQASLQTTGHNIANTNTRGYTRQVVNLVAARPMEAIGMQRSTIPGQSGQSVEFTSITRIREQFLDDQFRNQNKFLGEWTIRRDTLEKLEAIVNEPSDTGIRQVMSDFWNAWQELSKTPDNMTARAVVKESALALTDAFNFTAKQLSDLSVDLNDGISVKVTQINTLTSQIAQLNEQIYRIEGIGDNANDLRDQRDVMVDDLSAIVNIDVVELESGYSVTMGNMNLVEGREVQTLLDVDGIEAAYAGGDLNTGEVYGMIYSRDVLIASYRDQLNTLISTMAAGEVSVTLPQGMVVPQGAVINGVTYNGNIAARTLSTDTVTTVNGINGLHQLGYVMGDTLGTAPPLFVTKDGSANFSAENITLNPNIALNIELLATSARTFMNDNGVEAVINGNNDMALLIAGLRSGSFDFNSTGNAPSVLNGGSLDEYFRAVVGQIGVQSQEAVRNSENQQVIVAQVESRRQSVSGVSLDEEMSNLIKFQHAYNAAARAMTSFDEILDKVINGMGIVGR